MKSVITLTILMILAISCSKKRTSEFENKRNHNVKKLKYARIIDDYLKTKIIEPTMVYNNNGTNPINLLSHRISWKKTNDKIEIYINGDTINPYESKTLNEVWGKGVKDVFYLNNIRQIKLYDDEGLIAFLLTYHPCNGLGCGANYQLIYDIKTGKQSYFGRFRTGYELELYNFNNDSKPDFLSKTFYGRNKFAIDTTLFQLFSKNDKGVFEEYSDSLNNKFSFKHIYPKTGNDSINEIFEENWTERIEN